ncbi:MULTISPECIES: LysR family transcriptional regulator [unclassified Microbacterium]|uniref:LysR family transcriptional regulator n=1 Tax=unclassified Microbacterium TaxID=2609290 RepID=UPI0012F99ABA|nr:LysR family transcriptional regulator [Microbacterium sp. MAH-37]MVQ43904.1 LysR family transcriptional regulator [Microbacterium sp. MAH-37]
MRDVPDLDALELLVAAVRLGSISAAARECGISQQSASARLRGVERMLGMELFLRTPQGVVPTPEGETVASWAGEVLAAAERFRAGAETMRDERRRELVVAASQTVAAHMVPRWLVALRDRQVRAGRVPTAVRLLTANSAEVEQLVRTGRAELGLIESPVIPAGLSHSTVGRDELVLVVAPDHPWARGRVLLDELAGTPLVAREQGSGTRQAWEDEVRSRLYREPAGPLAVMSTTAAVRSAVAEGLGPAVLSRLAVADDIRLGRLVEVSLADAPLLRPITALWRGGDGDLTPTSRELIEVAVGHPG